MRRSALRFALFLFFLTPSVRAEEGQEIGPSYLNDRDQLAAIAKLHDDLFLVAWTTQDPDIPATIKNPERRSLWLQKFDAGRDELADVKREIDRDILHVDASHFERHDGGDLCPAGRGQYRLPESPPLDLIRPEIPKGLEPPPPLGREGAIVTWGDETTSWLLTDGVHDRRFEDRIDGQYPSAAYGAPRTAAGCRREQILLSFVTNEEDRSTLWGQFLSAEGTPIRRPFVISAFADVLLPGNRDRKRVRLGKTKTIFVPQQDRWLVMAEVLGPGEGEFSYAGQLQIWGVGPDAAVGRENLLVGHCDGSEFPTPYPSSAWRHLLRSILPSAYAYSSGYCHPFSVTGNDDITFDRDGELILTFYTGFLKINFATREAERIQGEGNSARGGEGMAISPARITKGYGGESVSIPFIRFKPPNSAQLVDQAGRIREEIPSLSGEGGTSYVFPAATMGRDWLAVLAWSYETETLFVARFSNRPEPWTRSLTEPFLRRFFRKFF